jgi:hypothetical protein
MAYRWNTYAGNGLSGHCPEAMFPEFMNRF